MTAESRKPEPAGEPEEVPGSAELEQDLGVLTLPAGLHRLLVESVRDYAIFVLDPTGHIVTWNIGAERLKGWTAEEAIGNHFSMFYPQVDKDRRKPQWELEVAEREGRLEDEGWRLRKDGTQFWANVVITALRGEDGKLVGFAKVTRDLTERRAAEQRALEDMRRLGQAEAASRAKSEFLATLSHELRTPLNAIGGFVELLSLGVKGDLTEEQRDYLDRIRRSQQHLLALINDLLNYSRVEAGTIDYDVQEVRLVDCLDEVTTLFEAQVLTKGLTLGRGECGPDVRARTDRAKLQQIVLNLVSNAVKFTHPGGTITLACGASADRVWLSVTDTGVGIPEEKLDLVFEPFVQVGRSLANPQEGTGLGLAISRDLARAMGGDLTAESEMGVGSTFRLSLPKA